MGSLIAESSGVSTHTEENIVENDFKDVKKKKRRSRKSKQTLSASTSASEICIGASNLQGGNTSSDPVMSNGHHQLTNGNSEGIGLMSSMHGNGQTSDVNLQSQQLLTPESKEPKFLNSVSEPAVSEELVEPVLLVQQPVSYLLRKNYAPHWSADAVSEGLEKGELLRAQFRVNAYNRDEGYCKIDGVQTDILICGMLTQNRASDGDIVAIDIHPPAYWSRMKGLTETTDDAISPRHFRDVLHNRYCLRDKWNSVVQIVDGFSSGDSKSSSESDGYVGGCQTTISDCFLCDPYDSRVPLEKLCAIIDLFPSKRPTGSVVAVIERSVRCDSIVGFLNVKQWIYSRESRKKNSRKNKHQPDLNYGYVLLTPTDPRFTKMIVPLRNLPESIRERLEAGDKTIESDLVGAKVVDWAEDSDFPEARVVRVFGRGSDVESQISAILYENAIDTSDFSSEVLSCLPHTPWEVPPEELQSRRDLRNLCIFTIDPPRAIDLDDALSVEKLSNGNMRVGVHIADVSYFVLPDTALDIDARIRSATVYLLMQKLPMLPPMLSDDLASVNPGVDRLSFSIFWDMDSAGGVVDRWIGRTIIRSCCKLSYEHAQDIVNGLTDFQDSGQIVKHWPNLYGQFEWCDVIESVKRLHEISKLLRKNRFEGGALSIESPKVAFLFDEEGIPYDTIVSERKDSHFLVEEFMLLANRTAAEVITRTYPSCALLRRHPEPNARKLVDFDFFCRKHGLNFDFSSSVHYHHVLEHIKEEVKNDPVFCDILMSYAARPMQLATYFCSGFLDTSDYSHYALAVPLYTHFTSPLRRYPDIVVHRTLAAALEAEDNYLEKKNMLRKITNEEMSKRCFTGICFDKDEIESVEAQEALSAAALKHRVPATENLADLAVHCNDKRLATRHVKDAIDKLYMWGLLKKKETLYSDARVLALGPRFMSIYITKLAIERRIHYDEVEGLAVEWLETTSTLVLSQSKNKRTSKKVSPGKYRTIDQVALTVSPIDLNTESFKHVESSGDVSVMMNHEPVFFPLTLHLRSTIPVALHAVGGDDGPLDIVARLYITSYFH